MLVLRAGIKNAISRVTLMSAADKPFDVFISHSTQDGHAASAIKQHLHAAGLKCWKAPDDIHPGESWPSAITRALSICRVMVLVWSRNSLASKEVAKELTLAMRNGLTVIPFRIEDVEPTAEWDYHLANTHWMDAFPGDLAPYVEQLASRIHGLLTYGSSADAAVLGKSAPRGRSTSIKQWSIAAVAVALAAVGAVSGAFWFFSALPLEPAVASKAEPEPPGLVSATTDEMDALREKAKQAEMEKAKALQEVSAMEKESLRQAAQRAEAEKHLALERAAQAEAAAREAEQSAQRANVSAVDSRRLPAGGEPSAEKRKYSLQLPSPERFPSYGIWLFPDSSTRILGESELRQLGTEDLWRARNEIYARRGYIFQSDRGKKFARSLGSAYRPIYADEDAVLSAMNGIERSNIERIRRFEKSLGR